MKTTYIITIIILMVQQSIVCAQDVSRPDEHAPIGVMGDHTHAQGEFMISYRLKTMYMDGSLIGSDEISADEIVTTIPNRFADMPMMPPTLRVVPLNMTMTMHMLGVMYAPTNKLTLMAMGMYMNNSMDHVTYQGGMGDTVLGSFNATSSGIGDTKIIALYRLTKAVHLNFGLSFPTGSIEERAEVLSPMDMQPTLRVPYPMQIGSGTYDLLPALTYTKRKENLGWGGQVSGIIRLGENKNDFQYGSQFKATVWGSYLINKWLSSSTRLISSNIGKVDGMDPEIMAPVQTADPAFNGGYKLEFGLGANLIGQRGIVKHHRLAAEFIVPIYQNLNGPQLKTANVFTIGWQYAF